MHEVLAHIVTAIFNLPDWAPRLLRRSAALVLVLVILLAPGSFRVGFSACVQIETTTIMKRMAPLLHQTPNQVRATLPCTHGEPRDLPLNTEPVVRNPPKPQPRPGCRDPMRESVPSRFKCA